MVDPDKKKRVYFLAVQLLIIVYFLAGFYPFQYKDPPVKTVHNGVVLDSDRQLSFPSPGIAYTETAPVWISRARSTSNFELSLEARAADRVQPGLARIFSLSLHRYRANLVVGQWGSSLNVRMRNPDTSLFGAPPYIIKNVFNNFDWHQIDIKITPELLVIRVDGRVVSSVPMPDQPMEDWDPEYRLALGNEFSGDQPWLGDIRKAVVRVDKNSFDYLTPGVLSYPKQFSLTSSRVVKLVPLVDTDFSRSTLLDWAVNLIGFVPLGWLVVMVRRPRPGFFLAIVVSAGISMTIEVGQLLVFTNRVPSSEDFILNVFGAALGAWLAGRYGTTSDLMSTAIK